MEKAGRFSESQVEKDVVQEQMKTSKPVARILPRQLTDDLGPEKDSSLFSYLNRSPPSAEPCIVSSEELTEDDFSDLFPGVESPFVNSNRGLPVLDYLHRLLTSDLPNESLPVADDDVHILELRRSIRKVSNLIRSLMNESARLLDHDLRQLRRLDRNSELGEDPDLVDIPGEESSGVGDRQLPSYAEATAMGQGNQSEDISRAVQEDAVDH